MAPRARKITLDQLARGIHLARIDNKVHERLQANIRTNMASTQACGDYYKQMMPITQVRPVTGANHPSSLA